MAEIVPAVIAIWIACAIGNVGLLFAASRAEYPERNWRDDLGADVLFGCYFGVFGPIGLFIVLCITGFGRHGWKLWEKRNG